MVLKGRMKIVAFLLVVALTPLAAHALTTTPTDILANPERFDGQTVTITGTIVSHRETVSRRGNLYYTLGLSDGTSTIRVFSFGTAPCRSGVATAEGTFEKLKRVGQYTFQNELTATRVTCG